jgi:hypothetical protein
MLSMANASDMMAYVAFYGALMTQVDWTEKVKGLLKAELKKRNLTYAQLVEKLGEIGVSETEVNVRNKIARGGFTAVFLIQCLTAIGARRVELE